MVRFLDPEIVEMDKTISGSRNHRNGAISGSRNRRKGRQILYGMEPALDGNTVYQKFIKKSNLWHRILDIRILILNFVLLIYLFFVFSQVAKKEYILYQYTQSVLKKTYALSIDFLL